MNILDTIVQSKLIEVESLAECEILSSQLSGLTDTKPFIKALERAQGPALIAEIKKASPSKGIIRENFDPYAIAQAYAEGGAHCLSILTDEKYFQGKLEYLRQISKTSTLPCLRKDFIIDKKQILESRINGADCILLIAAILDSAKLKAFHSLALDLGMDVLVEVHDEVEMLKALESGAKLIGINNRNLKTFEVDIELTIRLVEKFRKDLVDKVIVCESGIYNSEDLRRIHDTGVKAFLVGEALMKAEDVKLAVEELLE